MGVSLYPSISTSGGLSRIGDNGSAGLKLGLRLGEDEELLVMSLHSRPRSSLEKGVDASTRNGVGMS
jgi:hypothetical protein